MGREVLKSYEKFTSSSLSAVCLGNFDGVHRGHQKIISTCLDIALRKKQSPICFSFDPHPSKILRPDRAPKLILTPEEKLEMLMNFPFSTIINQTFDRRFSEMSAVHFAENILDARLHAKDIVVGRNFRFGKGAAGTPDLLEQYNHWTVDVVEPIPTQQGNVMSSTRIREWISSGEIQNANEALGYHYFLTGIIEPGDGKGGPLGFHTANLRTEKECLPGNGVYASVYCDLETGRFFPAATNVGVRPTLHGRESKKTIESHLMQFSGDLYSRKARLYLLEKIRDERQFSGLEELRGQIGSDVQKILDILFATKIFSAFDATQSWSLSQSPTLAPFFRSFPRLA